MKNEEFFICFFYLDGVMPFFCPKIKINFVFLSLSRTFAAKI